MAVKKIAYLVFVFPVIISLILGGFVLSNILGQPDRNLNMWQFKSEKQSDNEIEFLNLRDSYPISAPINFSVKVNNTTFDCGDLYMTIYDLSTSPKNVIIQHGYLSQCFVPTNSTLPIQDMFSPVIDKVGQYQIIAEMKDKTNQNSINVKANLKVQ